MGRYRYEPSEGAAQHRRTVYAFWRRSSAPTFLFDSAQRRVCETRMTRTNTPLHALTMLNDGTVLEASRKLAEDTVTTERDVAAQLRWLVQRVLSREATDRELVVLRREWDRAAAHFRDSQHDVAKLNAIGQRSAKKLEQAEVAAHFVVANLLLNLDEALTRE